MNELDLPAPDARMTPNRKAAIVRAVKRGVVSLDFVLTHYNMTIEEFDDMRSHMAAHGRAGLRLTRIQNYRQHRHHLWGAY